MFIHSLNCSRYLKTKYSNIILLEKKAIASFSIENCIVHIVSANSEILNYILYFIHL